MLTSGLAVMIDKGKGKSQTQGEVCGFAPTRESGRGQDELGSQDFMSWFTTKSTTSPPFCAGIGRGRVLFVVCSSIVLKLS